MRKWNAVLSLAALVLLIVHAVLGSFFLTGAGHTAAKAAAWAAVALLAIHAVLGVKYTVDSLRVWKKTGAGYFRENLLFWTRRLSGFALLFFLFLHLAAFRNVGGTAFRLPWFTGAKLAGQLLMVASLAVHLLTNIRPLTLALGLRGGRKWLGDALFVLSVVLLFAAAAFVIYYLRWNLW